ncbi:hypothetical protein A3D91_01305 [candidate division WWE3 bacterium RIFCSPHIGHO2_02_FULL_38_14]|uniref:Uncharacterized protein n=2 Tax=Katanobacteria TaxID=422282 RepID=A0A1F4V9D6_UNCKA|nr:MAG: hypothetical protein A3A69_01900 [candidate division WWE3 bacterium RIFCSPLOWO2_01_FULL_37_15]OGC53764.1 MAG: hypothetical protein A3D91_01305 [candidate division WWE3 bacterium RIFCSPHIGHO2_02_FULL_38_14]
MNTAISKRKMDKQKGNTLIVSLLIAGGVLVFLVFSYYLNQNKSADVNKTEDKMSNDTVTEGVNSDVVSLKGKPTSSLLEFNGEPNFRSEVKNGRVIWVYTFPEDESTGYYYYIENAKIVDYKVDEFTGTIDLESWLNQ